MTAGGATETGTSTEVATVTAAVEIATTTVTVVTATETDSLATTETERQTVAAATDPLSLGELSAATTSRKETHGGVHRRTLNHPSPPSMFDPPIFPAF